MRSLKPPLSATFALCLAILAPAFSRAEEENPVSDPVPAVLPDGLHGNWGLTSFYDPGGGGDWTAGLKWDLSWKQNNDWSGAEVITTGAFAFDKPELNQTPIVVQGRFGGYHALVKADNSLGAPGAGDDFTEGILDPGPQLRSEVGLTFGGNAKYETDQARDHSNGVFSAFVAVGNTNSRNAFALLPSLYLSIDAVVPDRNATAEPVGEIDAYGRFYAAADWYVDLESISPDTPLSQVALHVAVEYSKAFSSDPGALEATGQDETTGALVELLYELDSGFDIAGNKAPTSLFIQYSTGNFTPLPEHETRLLAGIRRVF